MAKKKLRKAILAGLSAYAASKMMGTGKADWRKNLKHTYGKSPIKQVEAYKRSLSAPWDSRAAIMPINTWKDGIGKAINFSYFSPYDSLYAPLEAAIAQAQKQNLNPQETEQYVLGLMFGEQGPVRKLLEPYISEPIGFDRFIDVTTRNGKKAQGGSVYTQSDGTIGSGVTSYPIGRFVSATELVLTKTP